MTILNILSFICLCMPTVIELFDDRHGDKNKAMDVLYRLMMLAIAATAAVWATHNNFFAAMNLSLAIHFLTFDYAINYILIKNGTLEPPRGVKYHWWTYQAKVGVIDNLKAWKNLNPYVKLLIRVTYFVGSLALYFTI